ncbi:MAG TPA: LptF/LptG family permease [Cyclobacteriaceae bacterium]|nr:LptF/LptG family permease [Cyclobacteriaceae bacterium]
MKKIDKLVLIAFTGPFVLTFLVVVFILLTQHMLKYFDDLVGKDLGIDVFGQLLFHFAVFMTPVAMPLAVLLSSLITFGNLGEHFELTAIKSAGISLQRTLLPIFILVIFLTMGAFYINNNLVPKSALEAYSLLYDIRQKKPALDLKEGAFYNGIPDFSIKVDKKFPDNITLKYLTIYDHRKGDGNKEVIKADSGRMTTILNERYLQLELFNGYNYSEGTSSNAELSGGKASTESITKSKFDRSQIIMDLSSFAFDRTDKKWFQGNRLMRNLKELDGDIDSLNQQKLGQMSNIFYNRNTFFTFHIREDSMVMPKSVYDEKIRRDSINNLPQPVRESPLFENPQPRKQIRNLPAVEQVVRVYEENNIQKVVLNSNIRRMNTEFSYHNLDSADRAKYDHLVDSLMLTARQAFITNRAANSARQAKQYIYNQNLTLENYNRELNIFRIQWHKIIANSVACIIMFLIGAPLGSIIKKGGLGVPVLVSIFFFIIFYLLSNQGEKWARQDVMSPLLGIWAADLILLPIGLFFLSRPAFMHACFIPITT